MEWKLKEAVLYEKLRNNSVRCNVCQRRCLIAPNQVGYCKTRKNIEGSLFTLIYGLASSINNDPIEKKPVFHYEPGSLCFSLGTFGCNFRCQFCQNWEIAFADAEKMESGGWKMEISPEEAVKMALRQAQGIAITYNEPTIWLEYSLDVFKAAKRVTRSGGTARQRAAMRALAGAKAWSTGPAPDLYTCWVTNGYATPEAIDTIAPYLDIYRVDLKSFDDRFYQKLINVPKAQGIFETTKYVHQKYPKVHIECITNIIPGWNDDQKTLAAIAHWIKETLGAKTPWHVTRFFPDAQMQDIPPTPPETLIRAQKLGFEEGLEFVYIGNMATKTGENTYCPKCKTLCLKRYGYQTEILAVDKEGKCIKCGEDLNIKM